MRMCNIKMTRLPSLIVIVSYLISMRIYIFINLKFQFIVVIRITVSFIFLYLTFPFQFIYKNVFLLCPQLSEPISKKFKALSSGPPTSPTIRGPTSMLLYWLSFSHMSNWPDGQRLPNQLSSITLLPSLVRCNCKYELPVSSLYWNVRVGWIEGIFSKPKQTG